MKRIMGALAVALVSAALLGVLAGCGGGDAGPKTVTETDSGKSVTLKQGQELLIVLEGNPTTGYTWLRGETDEKVIREVGDFAFEPESNLVGAGGTFTFTYLAAGSGSTVVHLDYARPWESTQAEQTFDVAVTVR